MATREEAERGLLWLCACTETDNRTRAMLREAKNSKNLIFAFEKVLSSVIKEREDSSKTRLAWESEVEDFTRRLAEKGYFYLTALSEDYPEHLLEISDAPLVLYGCGERALLKERKFCIVGSRLTPPYAEKLGRQISEALTEKFVIVTGLAEGGDISALSGAIKSGRVICVLPNGLNECYPASHASYKEQVAKYGLLLSEYLPEETVKKYSFHARNRILSGLCEGVLVLSAGVKSGTLLTANYALEQGRDVFALPYNVGVSQGAGCNELIKQGAYLCTGAEDIFSAYGMSATEQKRVELSEEERSLLEVLRVEGELHVAILSERTGKKIFEVTATLSALELKGLVVKTGGNRYGAI